ncbi:hypothetical protein C8R46DRAFT_1107854 [Mycena filopes]|nr:hypothetical protein C8R46DRAFT_1107854 [Mycena filopes]
MFFASMDVLITGSQNNFSLLKLFLLRSQNAPLSLVIQARANTQMNTAIVEAIIQQAPRWERLRIPAAAMQHSTDFMSLIPPHLPILETVMWGSPFSLTRGITAPRLQSLSIGRISEMNDVPNIQAHRISHLSAHSKTELWSKLLQKFPSVTHFTVRPSSGSSPDNPPPRPSVTVQKLTLLAEDVSNIVLTAVLNSLNLPSLEWLRIFEGGIPWGFIRSLRSHTDRSGCRLKTLTLYDISISPLDLVDLLRVLPALETLEMIWTSESHVSGAMGDSVLVALVPNPDSDGGILPALTKLVLSGRYTFSTEALLRMLELRLAPESPCASLDIIEINRADRIVSSFDLERFAALRAVTLTSLECLTEEGKRVWVCNGRVQQLSV